jgi:riboflavin biosynthesis pyrimidine reductase
MRVLLDRERPEDLGEADDERLAAAYAVPHTPWLRANMIATLDGAAAGPDGLTGSINNAPDHRVFRLLRRLADAVVVGAGTVRAEGYGGLSLPLVVVSRRGGLPPTLRDAAPGRVLMATCAAAPALAEARGLLGADQVLVLGEEDVDLAGLVPALAERGWGSLLCEGGPSLLRDLLAAGAVDEVCATIVPRVTAGVQPRMTVGPDLDAPLDLRLLLEEDGTLLGRWLVSGR